MDDPRLQTILEAWAAEMLKFYRPGALIPVNLVQFRAIIASTQRGRTR